MCRIKNVRIKPPYRNNGYSLGLEHPFIYGEINGNFMVWNRHTGMVEFRSINNGKWNDSEEASLMCYKLNGIDPNYTDPAVIDAMDTTA